MSLLTSAATSFYVALTLLLAVVALAGPKALKVGDAFPDLTTLELEGKLPGALKGKIVIVDFWASWCLPCAESFPALEELSNRYTNRVVIIGVSVDEKAANMEKFLKKHPVTFPTVRDTEHKLAEATAVQAMPTSFILDGTGKVRFLHNGFHSKETKKKYIEEIETLLKEKP